MSNGYCGNKNIQDTEHLGDLIRRSALRQAIFERQYYIDGVDEVYSAIDNAPAVDIDKEVWNRSNELLEKRLTYLARPKGEWVKPNRPTNGLYVICNQCQCENPLRTNFCPNCGAKMDMRGENDGFNG